MHRMLMVVVFLTLLVFAGPLRAEDANDRRDANAEPYVDAGVVLHLNSKPAVDTWRLGGEGRCLFYAITADQHRAEALRKLAVDTHTLGLLTVEHRSDLAALPLATNLANLVVVDDWPSAAKRGLGYAELLRVTAPFGSIYLGGTDDTEVRRNIKTEGLEHQVESTARRGAHVRIAMALPAEMGQWTHPIGNAGNRRVADDSLNCKILSPMLWGTLGRGLYKRGIEESDRKRASLWPRWIAGEHRSGPGNRYQALLAAGGRIFGVSNMEALAWHADEAVAKSSRGQKILVVRDAFSGLVQWYRSAPISVYAANHRAVIGKGSKGLVALDAASGEELWAHRVPNFRTLLLLDDLVVLMHGNTTEARALDTGEEAWAVNAGMPVQNIMADGEVVLAELGQLPPRGKINTGESLYARALLALSRTDGEQLWKLDDGAFWENAQVMRLSCVGRGRALLLNGDEARVLSLDTGKIVYTCQRAPDKPAHGYLGKGGGRALIQMAGDYLMLDTAYGFRFVDLVTGEEHEVPATTLHGLGAWACNGNGAFTLGMIMASISGEAIDPPEHDFIGHLPVKNTCGSVPPVAYNTAYSAEHKCCCDFFFGRLRGFVAGSPVDPVPPKSAFLQPGPLMMGSAFDERIEADRPAQWPCFRADNRRSCATSGNVASAPTVKWRQALTTGWPQTRIARAEWRARHLYSGRISAPVADESSVYVALPDDHQLVSLDTSTGNERWRFVAGGAIDSPPTLFQGRCYFGCRDGWLYSVNARSGRLIWRRRITPVDQRVQIYGQLENRFPLRGSVTLHNGRLYATAGLHGLMGVMLCVADPVSGDVFEYRQLLRGGYNNDVLVANPEGKLYLGPASLDPEETKAREIAWSRHRDTPLLRVNNAKLGSSFSVDYLLNVDSELLNTAKTISPIGEPQVAPAVRRVTFLLYLNGQRALNWAWNDTLQIGVRSRTLVKEVKDVSPDDKLVDDQTGPVFAMSRQDLAEYLVKVIGVRRSKGTPRPQVKKLWQEQVGSIWAMALVGQRVLVAGPVLEEGQHDPLKAQGRLWVLDALAGNLLSEIELPRAPVQDGIAVVAGRVYLSLCDGTMVCLQ